MQSIKKLSLIISLIICHSFTGTGQSYQEKYLQKSQDSKSFDKKEWTKLKKSVAPDSEGSTNNFGQSSDDIDWNSIDFDTEDSDISEGDNYNYEYEDYNDEYNDSDPNDPNDNTDYQRNGSYQKNRNTEGYDHYEKERERTERIKREKRTPNKKTTVSGAGVSFLQVLMWVVIIFLVAFLIYYVFINGDLKEKGAKVPSNFEDMSPSEIPKTELERRLEAALNENNYREAIRIYFIFALKDLSNKNWIEWEKEKTNISYLYEMRGRSQYNQFNEVVNIYDHVWYGEIELTKEQYLSIEPKYKSLLNAINS